MPRRSRWPAALASLAAAVGSLGGPLHGVEMCLLTPNLLQHPVDVFIIDSHLRPLNALACNRDQLNLRIDFDNSGIGQIRARRQGFCLDLRRTCRLRPSAMGMRSAVPQARSRVGTDGLVRQPFGLALFERDGAGGGLA